MRTTDSSFTAHEECEVFYCEDCKQTFTPQEVMATSDIQSRNMLGWKVACPSCGHKLTADAHIEAHQVEEPVEHLGELTYDLPGGHRAESVEGSSISDVQTRIDATREQGARHVRWARNNNASEAVDAADLKGLGV